MMKFTKKLSVVASLVTLCAGHSHASGNIYDNKDDSHNNKQVVVAANAATQEKPSPIGNPIVKKIVGAFRAIVPTNAKRGDPAKVLYKDIMRLILIEASKHTDPVHLASVNKAWREIMQKSKPFTALNLSTNTPFMKDCMDLHWNTRFSNGTLGFTPDDGGAVIDLKFSDLADPLNGSCDLSGSNLEQDYRITTSVEEFFEDGGQNANKLVVLVCPYSTVEKAVKSTKSHPFAEILKGWDKSNQPFSFFCRNGNRVSPYVFAWKTLPSYGGRLIDPTDWMYVMCDLAPGIGRYFNSELYYERAMNDRSGFHVYFDQPKLGIVDRFKRFVKRTQ